MKWQIVLSLRCLALVWCCISSIGAIKVNQVDLTVLFMAFFSFLFTLFEDLIDFLFFSPEENAMLCHQFDLFGKRNWLFERKKVEKYVFNWKKREHNSRYMMKRYKNHIAKCEGKNWITDKRKKERKKCGLVGHRESKQQKQQKKSNGEKNIFLKLKE